MGVSEVVVGKVRAALFQQVEGEVHEKWRLGAGELQRAAEVPLPGRQVVELREQQAEEVVRLSVVGVGPQGCPRHVFSIRTAPVREQELSQIVEGPICPRIDVDDRLQRARGFADLAASALHDGAQLERVHVSCCGFEPLFGGRFNATEVAALQGLAAAKDKRMGRGCHEASLGRRMQTQLLIPAMVPASRRLV